VRQWDSLMSTCLRYNIMLGGLLMTNCVFRKKGLLTCPLWVVMTAYPLLLRSQLIKHSSLVPTKALNSFYGWWRASKWFLKKSNIIKFGFEMITLRLGSVEETWIKKEEWWQNMCLIWWAGYAITISIECHFQQEGATRLLAQRGHSLHPYIQTVY
jgi:hypothetical protein